MRLNLSVLLFAALSLVASQSCAQVMGTQICEMAANGSGFRVLCQAPGNYAIGSPTFSRDGKLLATEVTNARVTGNFLASGPRHSWLKILATKDLSSSTILSLSNPNTPAQQAPGKYNLALPSWSPEAQRIAFSFPRGGVYVMRRDGSDVLQLSPSGSDARWSPDGTMIAYLNQRNGNRVHIYDLIEDEEITQSASLSNISSGFAWSPDSRSIAIAGRRANGKLAVCRMEILKPGPVGVLREGSIPDRISWHPDGNSLLCCLNHEGRKQPFTISAKEPDETPKLIPGLPDDMAANAATWSPDGKKIVFVTIQVRRRR